MEEGGNWTARRTSGHALACVLALGAALAAAAMPPPAHAQASAARALITSSIDERTLVRLRGNVRPEATPGNDRGRLADSVPLEHVQLLLRRPLEREQALERYLDSLHDRASPDFHRWLTPAEIAQRYGPAQQDIATVTGWLAQRGFRVNVVYPATLIVDFSGTAGQIATAFHCEIHALQVDGVRHIANMTDPLIPAALAPAVAGIVSLHDFRPHKAHIARAPRPAYTTGNTSFPYVVTPADLATIYNLNPVFAAGNTGQNQTIAVIEDSDVNASDWSTFRSVFGLSGYTSGVLIAAFNPAPPSGTNNCTDPGVAADEDEAIIDAEWASAAAPSAKIEVASCSSGATFGGLIALQNIVNGSSPPPILSLSYGECEALNGATNNAAYVSVYQVAVGEGISVFVSAGDQGAAVCDPGSNGKAATDATHGIGVNGFASTPYNVAVGGTDFDDALAGTTGQYWSSTNTATYGSALSYIPEIPWNDSCASSLLFTALGFSSAYGSSGYCNSSGAPVQVIAGSGGPSGCASGTPASRGVVGGTCQGTPKPAWQSGVPGIASDGVRDLPDVSLFASNGWWGHYYVVCQSDAAACTGAPINWSGAGGTSFAAPILAGFQALVDTHLGSRQANPNYAYYQLAASQFASGLNCSSTGGSAPASGCVFYDVVKGDIDVDCAGSHNYNCERPAGTYGALASATSPSVVPAFAAATGWDFATGLGTVNAYNLVVFFGSADVSVTASGTLSSNGELSYTLTVANAGPQSAAGVTVSTVIPAGMSLDTAGSSAGCTQSGQTLTCTLSSLAAGSTAALTILIQPHGASGSVDLTFSVTDTNGDLNTANNAAAVALVIPGGSGTPTSGDAPLPQWSLLALAAALLALSIRRRGVREQR